MSLGTRIRRARIKLGLSQVKLAKAAKINAMTVSNYETGEKKGLHASTLFRLASALETTPEYLMFGTRRKPVPGVVGEVKELVDACKGLSPAAMAKLITAAKKLQK